VGLCAERGLDLVIGVLGILKAGGAYVPIDPAYPAERVEYMLSDSRVSLLLTTTHLKSFLPTANTPCVLCLDAEQIYADQSSENPKPQVLGLNSSHLAYVIYTSGSTGQPKGVMVEHGGLCNLVQAQGKLFAVKSDSRMLQFASTSFDASVSEICVCLCSGTNAVSRSDQSCNVATFGVNCYARRGHFFTPTLGDSGGCW